MIIRNDDAEAGNHVDFVPMVDVLFNLLIFFLIATSMAKQELEMQIALPQSSASGPISAAMREIVINIDDAGRIVVNGRTMEPDALRDLVASAVKANPEQKVSVRGDRRVAYEHVARVLDVCKGAGVSEPFLETVPVH